MIFIFEKFKIFTSAKNTRHFLAMLLLAWPLPALAQGAPGLAGPMPQPAPNCVSKSDNPLMTCWVCSYKQGAGRALEGKSCRRASALSPTDAELQKQAHEKAKNLARAVKP